jgi:hypothetical protein
MPKFVQDLAGRLVGVRIHADALPPRQRAQRPCRQTGAEGQQQTRRPQAVAAEQGQEPGAASSQEDVVGLFGVGECEPGDVVKALPEPLGQPQLSDQRRPRPGKRSAGAAHRHAVVGLHGDLKLHRP